MRNPSLLLAAGVIGLLLIGLAGYLFNKTESDVTAQIVGPLVANIESGRGAGPVEVTFKPEVDIRTNVGAGESFNVKLKMEMVSATEAGTPLDADHIESLRTQLKEGMELRLNLAGATVIPNDWDTVGADLVYEWNVSLPNAGIHEGNILKRIAIPDGVDKSTDQIPFTVSVAPAGSLWTRIGAAFIGLVGFLIPIGTFYLAWQRHLREKAASTPPKRPNIVRK